MFVLFIATVIFGAEGTVVFVTRDRKFSSTADDFNLRGVSPTGTTEEISTRIRFFSEDRLCMIPIPSRRKIIQQQHLHFHIAGCVEYDSGPRILPSGANRSTVTLRSWYHQGGSDHNVSFAEKWYSVKTRAMVYMERDASMKRILFNRSTNWRRDTAFLHNVSIHLAMQSSCNKKRRG